MRVLFTLGAALAVWTCNVSETPVEKVVNIGLDDSLTVDAGLYDTLRVDIRLTDGKVFKEKAFFGPYHENPEGKLRINLGVDAPRQFDIILIAYRNGKAIHTFKLSINGNAVVGREILVTPGTPGSQIQVTLSRRP